MHKGTDTDVVAEGNYPAISLVNGDNNGLVSVRINYTDKTYRADFEQKEPEFDIVAQGHEPKAVDSDPAPEYGQETAKITVKIKF